MKDIKVIRFLGNDDMIAEIIPTDDGSLVVKNPLRIVLMPNKTDPNNPNVGFIPWMEFTSDKELTLNRNYVMTIAQPVDEFIKQYKSVFSGLALPKTQIIMPS